MFCIRFLLKLVLQSTFLIPVLGYRIDQSCADEGVENDIRSAMTSAFEMVDAASNRLTASPLDQSTLDLVAKLFAKPSQDPRTAITAKTVDVFARIGQMYRNEVPRDQQMNANDVVSGIRRFDAKAC
jgi:hypothetical protein